MSPARIAHLTSVHPRDDSRIFLKQCRTLAAAGHEVHLVVGDGLGDAIVDGVRIADVGRPRRRSERMLGTTRLVLRRALDIGADLYHLHDPELLTVGLTLKRRGARVVFDAHEDLPRQVLSKPYLPGLLRPAVSALAGSWEQIACRRLDAVVAATPTIHSRFERLGIDCTTVANFPLRDELSTGAPWGARRRQVCYVGTLSAARGIGELVAAMGLLGADARLGLAGRFHEEGFRARVAAMPGWSRVDELGHLARPRVAELLGASMAGMVTLLPTPAYREALPIKMFEYMSAGLPVIASDFPLWRDIVEGSGCGLCVDPARPSEIAAAIDRLTGDPDLAREMGERGRRAVAQCYGWDTEADRLLALYRRLLAVPPA